MGGAFLNTFTMKIQFIKDYAQYKKGDNIDTKKLGSILTNKLIRKYKAAKEYKPTTKKNKDEILGKERLQQLDIKEIV